MARWSGSSSNRGVSVSRQLPVQTGEPIRDPRSCHLLLPSGDTRSKPDESLCRLDAVGGKLGQVTGLIGVTLRWWVSSGASAICPRLFSLDEVTTCEGMMWRVTRPRLPVAVAGGADGTRSASCAVPRQGDIYETETGQARFEPVPLLTGWRDGIARVWDWKAGRLAGTPSTRAGGAGGRVPFPGPPRRTRIGLTAGCSRSCQEDASCHPTTWPARKTPSIDPAAAPNPPPGSGRFPGLAASPARAVGDYEFWNGWPAGDGGRLPARRTRLNRVVALKMLLSRRPGGERSWPASH